MTGGAGFIGLNILEYFGNSEGYKISVLDDLSTGDYSLMKTLVKSLGKSIEERFSSSPDRIYFLKGDIRNREDIKRVITKQDYVIHLAGKTGVLPSIEDPEDDAVTNVLGTLNMLRLSVENRISKFIFASSGAVLGKKQLPFNECVVPEPLSPYGASKLACEGYCSAFFESFGLPTVVVRFPSIYGKYSMQKESLIAKFVKNVIAGKELAVNGDGNQTRDFLYAGDIAGFISRILEKKIENFEIFQLGTGRETSVMDVIDILKGLNHKKITVVHRDKNRGEIHRNYSSIKKFISCYGDFPKTSPEEGIKRTFEWFKENMEK